jgi:hypothetical protein
VVCLPAHAPALKQQSPTPNQEQAYQQDQRGAVQHLGERIRPARLSSQCTDL